MVLFGTQWFNMLFPGIHYFVYFLDKCWLPLVWCLFGDIKLVAFIADFICHISQSITSLYEFTFGWVKILSVLNTIYVTCTRPSLVRKSVGSFMNVFITCFTMFFPSLCLKVSKALNPKRQMPFILFLMLLMLISVPQI